MVATVLFVFNDRNQRRKKKKYKRERNKWGPADHFPRTRGVNLFVNENIRTPTHTRARAGTTDRHRSARTNRPDNGFRRLHTYRYSGRTGHGDGVSRGRRTCSTRPPAASGVPRPFIRRGGVELHTLPIYINMKIHKLLGVLSDLTRGI
jgi:hypothetical protein